MIALLTLFVGSQAIAQQAPPKAAVATAVPRISETPPMAKFAREQGFLRCAGALESAERNLLGASDYTFRAYPPKLSSAPSSSRATNAKETNVFTAIVDARKRNLNEPAPRATLNITVLVSPQVPNACTTMYEQTTYHNATCDAVVAQMAPNGRPSTNTSLGSVLVEVSDNLTLTLIPVGTAQCITVIKEAAFDVPNPAPVTARR
jgi:hypothetical protein